MNTQKSYFKEQKIRKELAFKSFVNTKFNMEHTYYLKDGNPVIIYKMEAKGKVTDLSGKPMKNGLYILQDGTKFSVMNGVIKQITIEATQKPM